MRVEGVVQGVGFRPFVHALANRLKLAGFVGNDATGVFCEAEGDPATIDDFVDGIRAQAPPLAVVERVTCDPVTVRGDTAFAIVESRVGDERRTAVTADTATCGDCLRELFHPADRRHRYAFINCTNCGPRFTIVDDVPYDRANTTMAGFTMCEQCRREYDDPTDRRFHAQPTCCPACGPRLVLVDREGREIAGDPIEETARVLEEGMVVAIKGLGGYHLGADAGSEQAVAALRARKHREDKPFAVMAPDVDAARGLAAVGAVEERLLTGPRQPIVLLARYDDPTVAPSVAPGNRTLGVMLPYTPAHHLLARAFGRPFVLTSGNVSDEPIAFADEDAFARLRGIADAFLTHDRPIRVRTDDSVVRTFRDHPFFVRRSRGYAPEPFNLAFDVGRATLGCGAELKHTFCLATGERAFLSHHIGDLENYETLRSFTDGVAHFRRLFDIEPEIVAHDLHPEYLSTKYALELDDVELVAVQHHHAHIASCLADSGEAGPVIGVAFDGLGYGADGTIWGGELLVADLDGYRRAGHVATVPMPGGTAAIREPWRMAAAWLDAAFDGASPPDLAVMARNGDRWSDVVSIGRSGGTSPQTSSAGRLFDAVAAIVGVRDAVNYEGQAAIELEQLADPEERGAYSLSITDSPVLRLEAADLVRAVVDDVRSGVDPRLIAARFHNGLANGVVQACRVVNDATGLRTVALSGGVFQNVLFLGRVVDGLEASGLRPLLHSRVPPNDGGISLGQVAVAAAQSNGT